MVGCGPCHRLSLVELDLSSSRTRLSLVRSMSKRDVIRALTGADCHKLRDKGDHEVWGCPCGEHQTSLPRHNTITAGVIRAMTRHMACLPKGWLQ